MIAGTSVRSPNRAAAGPRGEAVLVILHNDRVRAAVHRHVHRADGWGLVHPLVNDLHTVDRERDTVAIAVKQCCACAGRAFVSTGPLRSGRSAPAGDPGPQSGSIAD